MERTFSFMSLMFAALLCLAVVVVMAVLVIPAVGQIELGSHATIRHESDVAQDVAQAVQVPHWLANRPTYPSIPAGIPITAHAEGHQGQALDAWKLYDLLLEGKCVASGVWCGATRTEQLYLCIDPVTGLIGGLFRDENGIWNGFAGSIRYWEKQVHSNNWEDCR